MAHGKSFADIPVGQYVNRVFAREPRKLNRQWSPEVQLLAKKMYVWERMCPEDLHAWLAFASQVTSCQGVLRLEQWMALLMGHCIKWPESVLSLGDAFCVSPLSFASAPEARSAVLAVLRTSSGKPMTAFHDACSSRRSYSKSGLAWFAQRCHLLEKGPPCKRKLQDSEVLLLGRGQNEYHLSVGTEASRKALQSMLDGAPQGMAWPSEGCEVFLWISVVRDAASQALGLPKTAYTVKAFCRKMLMLLPGGLQKNFHESHTVKEQLLFSPDEADKLKPFHGLSGKDFISTFGCSPSWACCWVCFLGGLDTDMVQRVDKASDAVLLKLATARSWLSEEVIAPTPLTLPKLL